MNKGVLFIGATRGDESIGIELINTFENTLKNLIGVVTKFLCDGRKYIERTDEKIQRKKFYHVYDRINQDTVHDALVDLQSIHWSAGTVYLLIWIHVSIFNTRGKS